MNGTFREIDGCPIFYEDDGSMHACEGANVHPGVRLIWTLCEKDVPANSAFTSRDAKVTCAKCLERSAA